MPKLKSLKTEVKHVHRTVFSASYEISVSMSGDFYTSLDYKYIFPALSVLMGHPLKNEVTLEHDNARRYASKFNVKLDDANQDKRMFSEESKLKLLCANLNLLESILNDVTSSFFHQSSKTELVILFNSTSSTPESNSINLSLRAKVCVRKTTVFENTSYIHYVEFSDLNLSEFNEPEAILLNQWTAKDSCCSSRFKDKEAGMKEIPYSKEKALFFVEVFNKMLSLNTLFNSVFESEESLNLMIESKNKFLLS